MVSENIKIFIIDESPVYRDIFIKALSGIPDISIVGKTLNEELAFKKLHLLKPDQIILDVEMKNFSAAQFTKNLLIQNPRLGILLTCKKDPATVEKTLQALESGAYDFIIKPKTNDEKEIIEILQRRLPAKIRNFSTKQYSSLMRQNNIKNKQNLTTRLIKETFAKTASFHTPITQSPTLTSTKPIIQKQNKYDIVVIGASTGGPEALTKLIPSIPKSFSIPIVVAVHMPKLFTASLASILNKRSPLNVLELSETEEVLLPGNVYIAKGGRNVQLRKDMDTIFISSKKELMKSLYMPCIDSFFENAASVFKNNVLAIILTGMGNDGVEGMRMLHKYGASTIAQDQNTSVVWGMPGAAVKAGCVDEILPINDMATRILTLTNEHKKIKPHTPIALTEKEFQDLSELMLKIWGISISPEKSYLFTTRLESLLKSEGYNSFKEFHLRLILTKDKKLEKKLVELMTTNETAFFRDKHPYENLEKNLIPLLASRHEKSLSKKIKIWSAGCSKGQEPYSIAIKIAEWVKTQKELTLNDFSIYASDISERVLKFARERTYLGVDIEKDVSENILNEYFDKIDTSYKIKNHIYKMITFDELNLSLPFEHLGKFDLIFCRNVMIYFSQSLKEEILEHFYNLLKPDGFLVIGASETLYKTSDKFTCIQHNKTSYYKISSET